MEQKNYLGGKYIQWLKERFPITGALLYAGSLFYLSYFFGKLLAGNATVQWLQSIPGFAIVFLVLFHIRIFDEHKDFKDDLIAHPGRLLSKGIITLKDLRILLYIAIALEFCISLLLGLHQFIIWLCIMGWSLLMLVEFFAGKFLKRNIGLYLFSHQLLIPLLLLFGMSLQVELININAQEGFNIILFLLGGMGGTITYEIARKTWSPDREQEHAESYTKEWGTGKAVFVNLLVSLLTVIIFCFLFFVNKIDFFYFIIPAFIYLPLLITQLLFFYDPVNKKSKLVAASGALFMLGIFVTSAIAFSGN